MIMRQWLELTGADTPDHVRRNFVFVVDLMETPGIGPELIAVARSERRRDGHLSEATLERIACDGNLSRVIMFGKSVVLDVGRTARVATNAQFRALIARDRHCQAPGCKNHPPAAKRTTNGTGPAAAPPTSTIWFCSVGTTTANNTSKTPKPRGASRAPSSSGRPRSTHDPSSSSCEVSRRR
jgi:hypothetical protein